MIDNNLNELNSIDFIIPRPGLEQSLVSDLWWLGWLCPSFTKTFHIITCIRGHHFIQETPGIIDNKLENILTDTIFELTLMI